MYPFGRLVNARPPSASGPRPLLVLGAYPSALHVEWRTADGKFVRAIPVDDEPEPFWNGADALERVDVWLEWLRPDPSRHGAFKVPPRLNGSSGMWIDDKVLRPLGHRRTDTWITDCLDTYRMSTGVAARIEDTYHTVSSLPRCHLQAHPSENRIVREALADHRARLFGELDECRPESVVTLGNAAARVFAELVGLPPAKLSVTDYGKPRTTEVAGRAVTWYPLAHPAAPEPYQEAHVRWVDERIDEGR